MSEPIEAQETDEAAAERFGKQLHRIEEASHVVRAAERVLADLMEQTKAARKRLDGAFAALLAAIEEPEQLPLFDDPADDAPDAWRLVDISTLGLPDRVHAALVEANLKTIGAIADFTRLGDELTMIDGIGEAAAEKISKATERYFAEHPVRDPDALEPEDGGENGEEE